MKNPTYMTDEDRWQAVLARDPRADEQFVFAVQTTGIVCRRPKPCLNSMVHIGVKVDIFTQRVSGAAGRTTYDPCRLDGKDKLFVSTRIAGSSPQFDSFLVSEKN